eukprot:TRINITY_DN8295_c0_g1_i1.p1 TRINITY_DN8295_c0_g1~~TRINITY_DN8295_c0_g1_i1.p1  ORF type:complete len:343 (+),score=71.14 TRINITY_DN8295_c0_g1_i1:55-1029(+)
MAHYRPTPDILRTELLGAHRRLIACEDAHHAAVEHTGKAALVAASHEEETTAALGRLSLFEAERDAVLRETRINKERAQASEAGYTAALQHERLTMQHAVESEEYAIAMRARIAEAEAAAATIEARRTAAAAEAAAAASALQEAIMREKIAQENVASLTREVELSRQKVNAVRADALLADEAARVKNAGHAAAIAGAAEAERHHQEQCQATNAAGIRLSELDHIVEAHAVDAQTAKLRSAVSQKELLESQTHEAITSAASRAAAGALNQIPVSPVAVSPALTPTPIPMVQPVTPLVVDHHRTIVAPPTLLSTPRRYFPVPGSYQ